jgi:hypothetical protein
MKIERELCVQKKVIRLHFFNKFLYRAQNCAIIAHLSFVIKKVARNLIKKHLLVQSEVHDDNMPRSIDIDSNATMLARVNVNLLQFF